MPFAAFRMRNDPPDLKPEPAAPIGGLPPVLQPATGAATATGAAGQQSPATASHVTDAAPPVATVPRRARDVAPEWQAAYLTALEASGQKVKAAKAAGIVLSTVVRRRRSWPEFARLEADAQGVFNDGVESEVYRRAVEGVATEKLLRKDGSVFTKIEYSDGLLLRLAERIESGTWRQKLDVAHGGRVEGVFMTRAERLKALADAEAEQAAENLQVLSEG